MPNPRLASRYAKSLVDLAIDIGQLEKIFSDMQWLQQLVKQSRDFSNLLRSPIVKAEKKAKVVDAVVKGKVNDATSAFLHLLLAKGRESNLGEIIESFISQYKEYKNIYSVKLTTAVPVDEDLKKKIISQIQKTSEMQNIELETEVDKDLIGGFVLEVGDKLIDASIAHELKKVSKEFENNDFVYRIR